MGCNGYPPRNYWRDAATSERPPAPPPPPPPLYRVEREPPQPEKQDEAGVMELLLACVLLTG